MKYLHDEDPQAAVFSRAAVGALAALPDLRSADLVVVQLDAGMVQALADLTQLTALFVQVLQTRWQTDELPRLGSLTALRQLEMRGYYGKRLGSAATSIEGMSYTERKPVLT